MKFLSLFIFFLLTSSLGFCQRSENPRSSDKVIVIAEKTNKKYKVKATFYGIDFRYGKFAEKRKNIVTCISFSNSEGKTAVYVPRKTRSGKRPDSCLEEGLDSVVTPDFYFRDIWSPDLEFAVLPVGVFDGFAVFSVKNLLRDIEENNYFDTLRTRSTNSGWYANEFEKWEGDSTFWYWAGLSGDMFAFKYEIKRNELYCYQKNCGERDFGIIKKGKVKAFKKGDIEPKRIVKEVKKVKDYGSN